MAKKIQKGKLITELVKGSLDYTMNLIRNAFRMQFPDPEYESGNYRACYIEETFSDYVIVREYGKTELKVDEYYKVTYSKEGETYTFAPRDQWEVVELAYQPQTPSPALPQMGEHNLEKGAKRKAKRFEETIANSIQLVESEEEEKNPDGPWRIRAVGITANIINGNGRRYPAKVLEGAVKELKSHLHESNGQGRMKSLTGESDHPADKGNRRSLLSEIVFNWERVEFDGQQVLLEGNLLGTSAGKDIHAQMRGGVIPGISQRGYGESKKMKEKDVEIEEITQLIITGYDGTAPNEQSDPYGSINYFETKSSEDDMNELLEQLKKLFAEHPELFSNGMTEAKLAEMNENALKKLDEAIRAKLNIGPEADIAKVLNETIEKARKFDEAEKKSTIEAAITEATKELPYGEVGNQDFVEAVREANPQDTAAVKSIVERQRKLFDKVFAGKKLEKMGFKGGTSLKVQPVLETETGVPEFARGAFLLTESIRKAELKIRRDLREPKSPNEAFTIMVLERFDAVYKQQLMAESRLIEEAEQTSDLNLPYSVSRAIIEEAFPDLVASGIFDVGVIATSPTKLFYEVFSGETGYGATITDEVVTGGEEDVWYALAHGRVTPDTVTVTSNPAGTTYVEGTDYIIDYAAGRIKFLTAGSIGANDVLVDYEYTNLRNGEMQPIQRGKITLTSKTIEAAADRLADQISKEAIVFSRSQLGYDAVGRTMANLVRQMRRKIDQGLLYWAFSAVKGVASNFTDTWTIGTTQDDYDTLVRLMGDAKVIVANRFYAPTFFLASNVIAEKLTNWKGFTAGQGFPDAVLRSTGFVGAVKGLPVFQSTEFPDSLIIAGNRELVAHRVFTPMAIFGPFPSYAGSGDTTRLVAADQYYAEEFNVTDSPVYEKGAFVPIEEAGS